jgi:hypothetical protein
MGYGSPMSVRPVAGVMGAPSVFAPVETWQICCERTECRIAAVM